MRRSARVRRHDRAVIGSDRVVVASGRGGEVRRAPGVMAVARVDPARSRVAAVGGEESRGKRRATPPRGRPQRDRKRVVWGKRGSVRGGTGGRRTFKKTKKK